MRVVVILARWRVGVGHPNASTAPYVGCSRDLAAAGLVPCRRPGRRMTAERGRSARLEVAIVSAAPVRHPKPPRTSPARPGAASRHRKRSLTGPKQWDKRGWAAAVAVWGLVVLVFGWAIAEYGQVPAPAPVGAWLAEATGEFGAWGGAWGSPAQVVSAAIASPTGPATVTRCGGSVAWFPSASTTASLRGAGPGLCSRRRCGHQRDRDQLRVARRRMDHLPAHRRPRGRAGGLCGGRHHPGRYGRPARVALHRDRHHVRWRRRHRNRVGAAQPACPPNRSSRKPAASAGSAHSRPGSG